MTVFRCIVSTDLFARALVAVSKEETRYYLTGVRVEPHPDKGALLVATNGHFLLAFHDPDGVVEGEGIVLLSKAMEKGLRAKSKDFPIFSGVRDRLVAPKLIVVGNRATVAIVSDEESPETAYALAASPNDRCAAYQWSRVLIDGTYPPWRRVIPEVHPSNKAGTLDTNYLHIVVGALNLPGRKTYQLLAPKSGEGGHLVLAEGGPSGFGVIMSIRSFSPDKASLPDWAQPEKRAEAA